MRSVFPSLFIGLYVFITPIYAQSLEDSIVKDSVEADVRWLASDQLKGRVNYSSEQIVAAQYLAKRFNDLHLTFFPGLHDYFMQFQPGRTRADLGKLLWNEKTLPDSLFYFFTPRNKFNTTIFEDLSNLFGCSYLFL